MKFGIAAHSCAGKTTAIRRLTRLHTAGSTLLVDTDEVPLGTSTFILLRHLRSAALRDPSMWGEHNRRWHQAIKEWAARLPRNAVVIGHDRFELEAAGAAPSAVVILEATQFAIQCSRRMRDLLAGGWTKQVAAESVALAERNRADLLADADRFTIRASTVEGAISIVMPAALSEESLP